MSKKGIKRTIDYFYKPKVQKEDVHETQPNDQQDVNENHVNESPRVNLKKMFVIQQRAFSAMKIVKTRLRTRMSDDYLKHCLIIYLEREISDTFTTDMIIDAFNSNKKRRVKLQMAKAQVKSSHVSDDETEWHL
ncbi:hypothetical protein CTI12_AA421900 [Artemisia annua]|uniref:Uncharacterized protein n=1 Tax=Artemisia annua TaxID=35608 RepID=A0A2U1M3X3_ARTAN|nr:hypothetical protein CTI12_AA421900 [Artemisia annua]